MKVAPSPSIEVFQDLYLYCPEDARPALRCALLSHVAPPWRHAQDRERALVEISDDGSDYMIFERSEDEYLPACTLALVGKSYGYAVGNVVPQGRPELTHSEYNDILENFEQSVMKLPIPDLELSIRKTDRYQSIDDWTSKDTVAALRRFSNGANKATGSAYPNDQNSWFQFLFAAHRCGKKIDLEFLERWLVEVENWPQEVAHDLACEYDYSMDLLAFCGEAA